MLGGETRSKALSILALLSLAVLGVTLVAMAGPGDNKTAANGKKTDAKAAAAPQPLDEEYTAKIKEYTTEKYFTTELVDHLPASATVPSPEKVLGYVIGAPNKLTYSKDIYRYYRALAAATPRVKVFTTGKTEEGREFMLVAVSDDANIKNLDRLKDITAELADPRKINDAEADKLIGEGKPFYWLVGSIHSPETGSPEMLMELAYRLAVENSPLIENIRKNSVVLITPVLEVDGRDREVDVYNYTKANPEKPAPNLIYWGHYVQHDNNRDAIDMALALSKEQLKTMFDWHATVVHDLHESEPFLYTMTGTGPYNAWFDPIVVSEWQKMAYHEIENFTARGVPGVWTHGFFDGWAPNYMLMIANGHNAVGRFYETFGNGGADTKERTLSASETSLQWYRENPPLAKFNWSMRDNTNYEESGVLFAMDFTATNATDFLHNFYLKSKRSVEKPVNEGPAAWAILNDGRRPALAAQLARLMQSQGSEVQRLDRAVTVSEPAPTGDGSGGGGRGAGGGRGGRGGAGREGAPAEGEGSGAPPAAPGKQPVNIPAGSYIIRMDQPYSRITDMLLDTQYYNVHDPSPYDDTGWTLGPLRNVKTQRITDPSILKAPMTLITGEVQAPGSVAGSGSKYYLINANAEPELATLRFELKDAKINAAEAPFDAGGKHYNAGTFIIASAGNPGDLKSRLDTAARALGIHADSTDADVSVAQHALAVPRIAIVHTWQTTQQEGWFRLAFEEMKVPYTYIDVHAIRDTSNLRDKFDVIIFPPAGFNASALIHGIPKRTDANGNDIGGPIPWKKTDLTPNIGNIDSTDDMRGGIEFEGVSHLQKFIDDGGLFIPITATSALPIETGITSGISITQTPQLQVRGSVVNADVEDKLSPIAYGYDDRLGVYFNSAPVFRVSLAGGGFGGGGGRGEGGEGRPSGRGSATDQGVPQGRPWDPPAPEPHRTRAEQELYVNPEFPRSAIPPAEMWPRVVLRFAPASSLWVSGMLDGGQALAEAPAVVDIPVGRGHVVFFANNPMWRQETKGSFMLVLNAALNYDHLGAGRKTPAPPKAAAAGDAMEPMPGHSSH
jgi:hypothetical protein